MASILAGTVELPTVICSMVTTYAGLHFHPDDQKGWLQILSIQFTNLCQRREKPGATDHHVTNDAPWTKTFPVGSLTCFRELKQQSILAIPRYMQIEQMSLVQDLTYTLVILTSGVLGCSGGPLSPKMILPEKSKSKHMEKEFCVTPCLAMVLGTEISETPSPRRPSDPVPCRKLPVWLVPHLQGCSTTFPCGNRKTMNQSSTEGNPIQIWNSNT